MANFDHNGHGHISETAGTSPAGNAAVEHEQSDVNIRGIVMFVIGLTVMTVSVYLLMLLMFNVLNKQEANKEQEKKQSPMTLSEKDRLPPGPRLQAAPGFGVDSNGARVDLSLKAPEAEYQVVREQWGDVLRDGPHDKNGKAVGMPIAEALKKVLEGNGLPARSAEENPTDFWDYATQMPTAASSGRTKEGRRQ